jgi:hypothetical protein
MRLILLFLNLCLIGGFHNIIYSNSKMNVYTLKNIFGNYLTSEEKENVYFVGFSNDESVPFKDLEINTVADNNKESELANIIISNRLKRMRKEHGGGFDQRDIGKTCLEKIYDQVQERIILNKLRKYNYQLSLLKKLENSEVSDFEKIKAIADYNYLMESSKYVSNIEAGGLYKNWTSNEF